MDTSTSIPQAKAVQAFLLAALELVPEERSPFLHQVCRSQTVRGEVESLLAMESGVVEALDRPICRLTRTRHDDERIGRYQIVRRLGEGGMGTVYLATRGERRVAVKVLRYGKADDDLARRFRAERQILTTLRHPGIAEIYEGGVTDDGRPYFVMEPVDGEPIDRFCDRRRLSVPERLRLYRKVCAAVSFAHSRHVVHRDLKPSNILVTSAGEPKLLDFGIAKLLVPHTEETLTMTAPGHRPMTPGYASPEHVTGKAVTAASDVYSLGILLYELLTGHRPYQLGTRDSDEIHRLLHESDPERPSVAVSQTGVVRTRGGEREISPETVSAARRESPQGLRRRLAGDLDSIVLTALRKDPAERYASVEELSEDVRRHLASEPVRANRLRLARRINQFLQSRAAPWGLVAVLCLGIFLGIMVPEAGVRSMVSGLRSRQLVNTGFETSATPQFGRLTGWEPHGGWTFHERFPAPGRDGLGERFGFYSAGAGETVAQLSMLRFEPARTYRFQSWALGGQNRQGRLPYLIGYAAVDGDVGSFVPLAVHVVDLDGVEAWRQTEGVSYTTAAAGPEIGRQIVLWFGNEDDGGDSDVWIDNVTLIRR